MSRRRRQGLSPSLFPFLAVLVCTLGTLILLLALVAQNASTAAASESEQPRQKEPAAAPRLTAESADSLIEEAEFRAGELIAFRDQQVADIEDRRDQVAHLDDHMRRLRSELERLNEEIAMVTGRRDVSAVDQQQLLELKSQIEAESRRVAELREQMENKTPRVVIVPHKGPNGTDRRPVYLECTADGLKIWPEAIRLPEMYLQDTVSDANPLDAALRVIRNHAMRNYGDTVAPYPLLVVRPDGIKTYVAARNAMRDWDDQFGYELVPADVKLAYDNPDPALKKKVDDAIRMAIIKQNAIQRLASRLPGRGPGGSSARPGKYPTLSAASMDQQGRASGFRNHRDGYTHQNPFAPQGNGVQYGDLNASGTGADVASKLDQHLRDAQGDFPPGHLSDGPLGSGYNGAGTDQQKAADGVQADAFGNRTNRSSDSSRGSGVGAPADGKFADRLRDPIAEGLSGPAGANRSIGSTTSNHYAALPSQPGQPHPGGPGSAESSAQPADSFGGPIGDRDANVKMNPHLGSDSSSQQSPGQQFSGQQFSGQQYSDQQFSGQQYSDQQFSGQQSSGQQSLGQQSPGQQSPGQQQPGQQQATASPSASANQQPGMAMPNTQASNSSLSSPTPMPGGSPGMTMPGMSRPPAANLTQPPQVPSTVRDLVRRQGANWALPDNVAGTHGNAIVRTIHVLCYPDRFVLLPPRGEGRIEMFGLSDGDINRATLELATAVRNRIARWGAALPGGRWQPRLNVEIMPHGDRRFHQLRMLMSGSGVDVEGRPSK